MRIRSLRNQKTEEKSGRPDGLPLLLSMPGGFHGLCFNLLQVDVQGDFTQVFFQCCLQCDVPVFLPYICHAQVVTVTADTTATIKISASVSVIVDGIQQRSFSERKCDHFGLIAAFQKQRKLKIHVSAEQIVI